MGLLDKLLHGSRAPDEHRYIDEGVARVLAFSPQLRTLRQAEARLAPAVGTAVRYLVGLAREVPQVREASAAAWASDPCIHAFFASPDDVAPAFSRSEDLRAFFDHYPDLPEAYALLGMAMTEKHILGVALEGDTMRRDVIQETISFSDHQVRVCGRTELELRQEIVRRLVDQLALEGMTRFAADQERRGELEKDQALLRTRLQLLERQGVGVRVALGDEERASEAEMERLRQQMADNGRELEALGMRAETLERQLGHLCAVLSEPAAHIYVERKSVRLNKMNVVLSPNSSEAGDDITFELARIPADPPRKRAFALVRFSRGELLPEESVLDRAARLLG
ncbi:hypothetical protein [Massilia solisilvae]|uniref:hypothetical protein n=1 Tax=Massilia solisilvae TaxID=1811225 RepID=UPI00351D1A6D